MWSGLRTALRGLTGLTRVLLISGDWSATDADDADALDVLHRIEDTTLVTIAALEGPVSGAGLRLALGCTVRFMAPGAELAVADLAAGAAPPADVLAALRRDLGFAGALELVATGRPFGVDEAVARGLALAGTAADARHLATAIVAAPDDAVRATVAALRRSGEQAGPRGMLDDR